MFGRYFIFSIGFSAALVACARMDSEGGPAGFLLLGGGSSGGGSARASGANWWSTDYGCRQQATVSATSAIVAGSLVSLSFDHAALVSAAKSLASGDDVRVSYLSGDTTTELERTLASGSAWNNAATRVLVKAQADIAAGATDTGYYLYYCNPSASAPTSSIPATPAATTESLATQTVSMNTTYNNMASATFTPTATTENWLWFVTFAIRSNVAQSTNDTTFLGRVTVNGVADTEIEQQSNEGNRWKMMIVAGRVTGTTATQTIGLDLKSAQVTTDTEVKNVRIVSVLLPPDTDFQYAASEAVTQTTGTWTNAGSALTFTPSSAGDYLIMAAGQHHENPSTEASEMRFVSDDGTFWPPLDNGFYSGNNRGSWDTFFVMRKLTLSASAKTFRFQFQSSGSGTNPSEYKGLRLFAFRADAFEASESQEDTAASSTTSTSGAPAVKSTLTTAVPTAARDFLIVQSMFVYDTDLTTTHQEGADFRVDGTVLNDQDHVLNRDADYSLASGCVSTSRSAAAQTIQNRYWTNNATATFAKESVIHVLRFKEPGVTYGSEETN